MLTSFSRGLLIISEFQYFVWIGHGCNFDFYFESNNTLTVTLWDEFADQITEFTSTNILPIIMVLRFAKIKFWGGINFLINDYYT